MGLKDIRESQVAFLDLLSLAPEGIVELLAYNAARYICQDPACRKEFAKPQNGYPRNDLNPQCACGSETKRVYAKPFVRILSITEAAPLGATLRTLLH